MKGYRVRFLDHGRLRSVHGGYHTQRLAIAHQQYLEYMRGFVCWVEPVLP